MPGRLYRIERYPGLVEDSDPQARVHGEVYALNDPAQRAEMARRLRGHRAGQPTTRTNTSASSARCGSPRASTITAWVYLYRKDVARFRLIPDGRWRSAVGLTKAALLSRHRVGTIPLGWPPERAEPGPGRTLHVEPLSRGLRRLEARPGGVLGRGRARDRLVQALGQGVRPLRRPVRPLVRRRRVQHRLQLPRPPRGARPRPAEGADLRQPRHQHQRAFTYAELRDEVATLGGVLQDLGVKPRATASSSTCR